MRYRLGSAAIAPFVQAFEAYWAGGGFATARPPMAAAGNCRIDTRVSFPRTCRERQACRDRGGHRARNRASSIRLLPQPTPGAVTEALQAATNSDRFVYGISTTDGLHPDEARRQSGPGLFFAAGRICPRVKPEPSAGMGTNMHHNSSCSTSIARRRGCGSGRIISPTPRTGPRRKYSDRSRRKIATSFMVEAIRIFDHYHFRWCKATPRKRARRSNCASRLDIRRAHGARDYVVPVENP